eukprot:UN08649
MYPPSANFYSVKDLDIFDTCVRGLRCALDFLFNNND